ncbi:hypothetical protein JOD54_004883 [Actinokineospora baliensis]|uniref:hypothetical protein n=1 Tax=Actinokineospora baliensis TaxID=547056 RepID=UPI0019566B57|nr:hypothetical protein [Actinokineospora baliensis]MBM7774679.1 hypothetical protein [Actinokineospora baliensis]
MTLRPQVRDLIDAGPFPDEDADEESIERTEQLLDRITKPVTDEEAQALATVFGPDDCYGMSWTLLHLIETAPGAHTARYPAHPANPWRELLNNRVAAGEN